MLRYFCLYYNASVTGDAMGRVTVSICGAEPRHTLIFIDGQPVMGDFAKYSGDGDELQRLGTENVDHIEIIQGAASSTSLQRKPQRRQSSR
ncbi:hypothetical protein BSR42_01050 [Megasphaera cerevisiae]|nr:hypothetical protein BSR42_01050 [Megasphaera cerevisiae]